MEPALRNVIGAVLLTETGEVDVEQLDQSLIHDIEEGHGAVLDAKVKKLDKVGQDWEVVFEVDGHEEGLRAGNVVSFAESNATEWYLSYSQFERQIHPCPIGNSDMAFARMALGRFGPIYQELSPSQISNVARGIQTFLDIDPNRLELVRGNDVHLGDFFIRDNGMIEVSGGAALGVAASLGIARHVADLVRKKGTSVEELAQGWE